MFQWKTKRRQKKNFYIVNSNEIDGYWISFFCHTQKGKQLGSNDKKLKWIKKIKRNRGQNNSI